MKIFTPQELQEILAKHALWLKGEPGGERANLSGADLSGANLERADLTHADLYGANLVSANLERANLECANLTGANLERADLYRTNLSNTILEGKTILDFSAGKHHAFYMGTDLIQIGCAAHPIKYWMDNFEKIGEKNNYTSEQIKKYGEFIRICAQDYETSQGISTTEFIKEKKTIQTSHTQDIPTQIKPETKASREVLLAHYGEMLMKEHKALVLASDIIGKDNITCLSMLCPGLKNTEPKYLTHEFEEGYCERVFPVTEYTVVAILPLNSALALLEYSTETKRRTHE